MPRRRVAAKREIFPDPKFNSILVSKFINCIMQNGKKAVAEKIVYGALERVNARLNESQKTVEKDDDSEGGSTAQGLDPAKLLRKIFDPALDNIMPSLEVRARRVGGSTYQIPIEVRPSRRTTLAMRWLKAAALERKEKTMEERLAAEILDACDNKGLAVKKREDTHRMANANQAFAHFSRFN
ncbi:MAG: 30S ribosomal protein S7 [Rickettsiella sp.]|nr:30S ribosomal protein S7 [Rickettsiella sp.]